MNDTANKWTIREVATNKFLPTIILTVLFTSLCTIVINKILTREVIMENGMIHVQNFLMPKIGQLLLAIPIFVLSTVCIQYFMNKTKHMYVPVKGRKEFKWYSIYSIFIGFLLFSYSSRLVFEFTSSAIGFVSVILISVIVGLLFHFGMLRMTKMNKRLITEIESGMYDQNFKDAKIKENVIKVLTRGHVSSVGGAVTFVKIRGFLYDTIFFLAIIFWKFSKFLWKITPRIGNTGGGGRHTINTYVESEPDTSKEDKRQADYKARQDQKQANYSLKHAIKQTHYNADYDEKEWNRYIHDQRKANRAKKEARRM